MKKNTSITLNEHYDNFIQRKIETGQYESVSEVVRSALRLLEREERKLQEIRQALIIGEESEIVESFNPDTHLKQLHEKKNLR